LNRLSEVRVRSRGKFDSWGGGGKLVGRRSPADGRSLIEDVAGVEVSNTLSLDTTNTKSLLVLRVKLSGKYLNDQISMLSLGGNVGREIGFTGFDGSKDGFKRMSTLFHITLDLPVKFYFVRDVEVKGEVKKVTYTFIVHGVKTLEDDDGGGFNGLRGIKSTVDVVVDGLGNSLSLLQSLYLLIHEIEVILTSIKSSKTRYLTSITVV